ncbi:MAG: universal stress protein [Thermodesulfovibrionales bacterium]
MAKRIISKKVTEQSKKKEKKITADQICPAAKLEKLLLATDRSDFSEGAVREAIKLAKTCGSKLHIISVTETPDIRAFNYPLTAFEKLEILTKQHLESLKGLAEKDGIICETIIRRGPEAYKYIVDEAEKRKVDMIIMGRRGKTGITRLMVGSVTAKVIGYAPCNVMVVPRFARITFEKILVPTDGSIFSELASREAISIAKLTKGSLIVLSVAKKEENLPFAEASVNIVKEFAEKEGVKIEALTLVGNPHEVIVETAEKQKAGFIIIGSHGRSGIERILMGSVTERVIGHAGCAVLVVRKQ